MYLFVGLLHGMLINNKNNNDDEQISDEIEIEISNTKCTEEPQTEENDDSIQFAGYVLRRSGRHKSLQKSYTQVRINDQIPQK